MTKSNKKWNILIVDDDSMIHLLTKQLLKDFTFEGKELNYFQAYSEAEAKSIIPKLEDLAVILLDVVMEEFDSGLKVVDFVRNQCKDKSVRIILRTGKPENAPEKLTILNYDINDYKTKDELMSKNKLFTTITWSLKSYRDIKTIEEHNRTLERKVKERTKTIRKQNLELMREKLKSEKLLLNTLPIKVVEDLKKYGSTEPENFPEVSVFFSDIVGFTNYSSTVEPQILIQNLNEMFTEFDSIMDKYKCERIKTIGDAYLAVCGMPNPNKNHAKNLIGAALEITKYMNERNRKKGTQLQIRIGIHSGRVVGGIVGLKKYIYDVFGDTINTASRMESNSEPMKINISEHTQSIVKNKFILKDRGIIDVKGKGFMRMFFVEDFAA